MKITSLLLSILLSISLSHAFAQTGSVTGIVTDSITGQPIANLTVFISASTYGTTTNDKGNYTLDHLPPGDYTLTFRHMSYRPCLISLTVESGKQYVRNLKVSEMVQQIDEVSVIGKTPDWSWAFDLFKEYFLGDPLEKVCILENPQDLKFFYQGDILTAYAKRPLEIVNKYLGYQIIYFLDYFKFSENKNPAKNSTTGYYYAYAGSTLFQPLTTKIPLMEADWKFSREAEFKGNLRHFLVSLYQDKLAENGYRLRKSYKGLTDLQHKERLSSAMTIINMAGADSTFAWLLDKNESGYFYYLPTDEYSIPDSLVTIGPLPGEKTACVQDRLLVFKDFKKTGKLSDDRVWTFGLSGGTIIFDSEGNFRVPDRQLEWANLDHSYRIRVMLPSDYLPVLSNKTGGQEDKKN